MYVIKIFKVIKDLFDSKSKTIHENLLSSPDLRKGKYHLTKFIYL